MDGDLDPPQPIIDNAAAPLRLTKRFSGDLGQENWEALLAEPSAPNRKANNSELDLPCPVCVGNPGRYSKVKYKCKQGNTYRGLSKLM
jgi:hypothetical protein